MKKVLLSAVLLFTMIATSFAADVDGVWKGFVEGQYNVTLTLKNEGGKLTGTFQLADNNTKGENPDDAGYSPYVASQLGKNAITDGKVDGDNITFTTTFNGKPVVYKGTIADGKLVVTTTFGASPVKFTVKQAPKA